MAVRLSSVRPGCPLAISTSFSAVQFIAVSGGGSSPATTMTLQLVLSACHRCCASSHRCGSPSSETFELSSTPAHALVGCFSSRRRAGPAGDDEVGPRTAQQATTRPSATTPAAVSATPANIGWAADGTDVPRVTGAATFLARTPSAACTADSRGLGGLAAAAPSVGAATVARVTGLGARGGETGDGGVVSFAHGALSEAAMLIARGAARHESAAGRHVSGHSGAWRESPGESASHSS